MKRKNYTTDVILRKAALALKYYKPWLSEEDAKHNIFIYTGFPSANSKENKNRDIEYERISWESYFMSLAFLVAMRSPDSQTQHGCVIVDKNNAIIATGYNGYLPGAPDDSLPNTRPQKYPYILHSEVNAILSAKRDLTDCVIYITGLPCIECLKFIIKAGIKNIIIGDRPHVFSIGYTEMMTLTCAMNDITITKFIGKLATLDGREITEKDYKHEQPKPEPSK